MKNILLFGSITVACGLLLTNLYTSIVDARSWGSTIPSSIATAREYYKHVNPGNFFRIFSPANQILSILALVFFWKCSGAVRICLGAAVVLYVACDALTFAYFYPRNAILFQTASLSDVTLLKKTWSEWSSMNWLRSLMLLAGIVLSFVSLDKIYTLRGKKAEAHIISTTVAPGVAKKETVMP